MPDEQIDDSQENSHQEESPSSDETPPQSQTTEQAQDENHELEKLKRDYLYLMADFDNFRKQAIKERSDLVKFGSERFIRDFLVVFDNFERALETPPTPENLESFHKGVALIAQEFESLLKRFGVMEIAPVNLPFDPNTHEALSSEPTDQTPSGHVTRVFRKGYRMHDRLLRPAQVVVATAPTSVAEKRDTSETE